MAIQEPINVIASSMIAASGSKTSPALTLTGPIANQVLTLLCNSAESFGKMHKKQHDHDARQDGAEDAWQMA